MLSIVTPPYFYVFHRLAFISHSAAVLWFNMVESAAVLGEILRSPKYFSVLPIDVPYSCSAYFCSTFVCSPPKNYFFAVNQGRLCRRISVVPVLIKVSLILS